MNSVASAPRVRKPRPRPARSVRVALPAAPGELGVMVLTVGKQSNDYFFREIPADRGRGFVVEKFSTQRTEDEPETYHVNLNGAASTCECKGFLRHGMDAAGGTGCKHIASLQALVNRGKL